MVDLSRASPVDPFTLAGFYERRARRILPALCVVMFVCLPLAWIWMLPGDLRDFSASIVSGCTFVSNILFWRESGYFASATDLKPLAHTWSLAVEEQYYLLYPLLLLWVWRAGVRWIAAILAVAAVISLGLAQWASAYHPQAAFYLLPTRAWELLLGAFAALYAQQKSMGADAPQGNVLLHRTGGLLGLLLIGYAVVGFDESTSYPGVYTLIPAAGAVLVILFAGPSSLAGRLLGSRVLVGLGLISYGAYLWHQPLFAFARHRSTSVPNEATFLLLSSVSIGLAYVSWRYIELPFRVPGRISRRALVTSLGLATAVLLGVGVLGYVTKGFSYRFADEDRYLVELDPYEARQYVIARFLELQVKPFDNSGRKKVAVIGDSYAEDLVNAVYESGLTTRVQLSTYLIPAACGNLFLQRDLIAKVRPADRGICLHTGWYDNEALQRLMHEADAIWLVSSWAPWQVELLPESLQRIESTFGAKVLVFGDKDFGTFKMKELLGVPAARRPALGNPMSDEHLKVNALMRSLLPRDEFLDVSALLCGEGTTCPLFTADGKLISYDGGHLTRDGARYYGEKLSRSGLLRF
jgi:peptidoglycan/LPS O-acetylase OafA/YrhL